MKELHLNVKRKWFDMILSGEKTEEYREIKNYWVNRLGIYVGINKIKMPFDSIIFSNGYAKNRDQFKIELKSIRMAEGKEEWGAEEKKEYFVLELGEIIWKKKI